MKRRKGNGWWSAQLAGEEMGSVVETGFAELSVFPSFAANAFHRRRGKKCLVEESRERERERREGTSQGKKAEESGEQHSLDAALEGR